jgi:hypothetical protein
MKKLDCKLLKELAKAIGESTPYHVESFDIESALCIASHLLGRRYETEGGLKLNRYTMLVGESGVGKNYAKNFAQALSVRLHNVLNIKSGATSDSGLFTALYCNPNTLLVIDEIGEKLNVKNNNGSVGYWSLIREVFNTLVLNDTVYSSRKDGKISENISEYKVLDPHLSILSMTTPNQLSNNLSQNMIENSTLNRFNVILGDYKHTIDNAIVKKTICADLVCDLAEICTLENDTIGLSEREAVRSTIFYSVEVKEKILKVMKEYRAELNKNRQYLVRNVERSIKTAGIISALNGKNCITIDVFLWALDYEYKSTLNAIEIVEGISSNEYSYQVSGILDFIKFKGESGVKKWEINKIATRKYGLSQLKLVDLLEMWREDKVIEIEDGRQGYTVYYVGYERKKNMNKQKVMEL